MIHIYCASFFTDKFFPKSARKFDFYMILDYWYFGPYGLLIEWIIAYRDYVYSRLLGFCGLWELGSCGLCGLWVQWLIGIMYTVACGDYGYFRPCGLCITSFNACWGSCGLCIQWIAGNMWIISTLDHVDCVPR